MSLKGKIIVNEENIISYFLSYLVTIHNYKLICGRATAVGVSGDFISPSKSLRGRRGSVAPSRGNFSRPDITPRDAKCAQTLCRVILPATHKYSHKLKTKAGVPQGAAGFARCTAGSC